MNTSRIIHLFGSSKFQYIVISLRGWRYMCSTKSHHSYILGIIRLTSKFSYLFAISLSFVKRLSSEHYSLCKKIQERRIKFNLWLEFRYDETLGFEIDRP